jgi:hypothetical protein
MLEVPGAPNPVLVLVGEAAAVEVHWRSLRSDDPAGRESFVAPGAAEAARICLERIAARARSAADPSTLSDLAVHWRGRAAREGEDDTSRIAAALFQPRPPSAAAVVRSVFGDDSEPSALRALRAAIALLPRPVDWLLVVDRQEQLPALVWMLDSLASPAFTLSVREPAWRWLVEHAPRAAARCAPRHLAEAPAAPSRPPIGLLRDRARQALAAALADPGLEGQAMSAAEAFLFAVLERRPSTAGRFVLDGRPGFPFGTGPCRVDLLAAADRVALEIDGPHHFADHDAYRRDRRKDLLLQRHGYAVLRVLALDVVDRLETILESVDSTLAWKSIR